MRKYSFSLLQKVLIAIILILLPIIITFIYNYKKDREHLEEYVKNDLTVMAEAYEGQVYQFLEMSRQRVQDFASAEPSPYRGTNQESWRKKLGFGKEKNDGGLLSK